MKHPVIEWASPRMVTRGAGRLWAVGVVEEKYYLTVELEEWEDG